MMNLPRTPVQRRGKAAPIKSEQPNEKELIERLRRFEMFEPLPVAILKTARIQLHRSGERLWTKASPTSGVSNRHPVPKIRVHSKAWVDENLTRPRIVIQANDRNPHARLPGRDHDDGGVSLCQPVVPARQASLHHRLLSLLPPAPILAFVD